MKEEGSRDRRRRDAGSRQGLPPESRGVGTAGEVGAGDALLETRIEELRDRLSTIVQRICPGFLSASREDLVQAATIRIWKRVQGEGMTEVSSSYLWKVAHSVLVDEIRRVRARRETEIGESEAMLRESSRCDPESAWSGREAGQAIHDCLIRLVPPRRRAVTAYLLGHSVPEIAALLGWTPKKAENLVYRGLGQMRSCLDAKGWAR